MEDRSKKLKIRFYIIFISFGIIVIALTSIIVFGAYRELFEIKRSNWLSMLFAWISSASAIFIGLIAYWQNERIKLANDISIEKSDAKSEKYQNQLLSINNRLIKLEENKEYAYITFTQNPVFVGDKNINFNKNQKTYVSKISNTKNNFSNSTIFVFSITNQTDVPIRFFEIKKLIIEYCDYEKDINKRIAEFNSGGFVPSPIIERGEVVNYLIVANELKDLADNLPDEMEINILLTLEVVSIYGRTVNQKFFLRLQRHTPFFDAGDNKNIFWNYCFEDTPKRIDQ